MVEQMIRKEAFGTSQQPTLQRALENALLGDARRRGETHQWMYDRVNLQHLLEKAGFKQIEVMDFATSSIPRWDTIGLDRDKQGSEYKPGSLYMEAVR